MEDGEELLGISSEDPEFQPLTPDELRETGAILPLLDGLTVWQKWFVCDYCTLPLTERVIVLERASKGVLTFMCIQCAEKVFQFHA